MLAYVLSCLLEVVIVWGFFICYIEHFRYQQQPSNRETKNCCRRRYFALIFRFHANYRRRATALSKQRLRFLPAPHARHTILLPHTHHLYSLLFTIFADCCRHLKEKEGNFRKPLSSLNTNRCRLAVIIAHHYSIGFAVVSKGKRRGGDQKKRTTSRWWLASMVDLHYHRRRRHRRLYPLRLLQI